MIKEKTTRIDKVFADQIEEIRKTRLDRGLDEKKLSDRKITALIPKHKHWETIKEEMMNLDNNTIKDILREGNGS